MTRASGSSFRVVKIRDVNEPGSGLSRGYIWRYEGTRKEVISYVAPETVNSSVFCPRGTE